MWQVLLTLVLILGGVLLLQIQEPMTDIPVPTGRFLPHVNTLGRGLDGLSAMDQPKGTPSYARTDFNKLFEAVNSQN